MKTVLNFFLLLLSLLFTPVNGLADSNTTFTVGIVPQFEARKLHATWRPVLEEIGKKTGYTFNIRGSGSIPEFERDFIAGKFDFAYMNPYHSVTAYEKAGYIPLLRDHARKLSGVLVVRKDSPIESPGQLEGQTLVFPSPNALGASLQMRAELSDKFGIKFESKYVKTHDSVYLHVLLGEAAAGGGVQKTLNNQKPEFRENLRVIYTTEKVNPHPIVVHPTVPELARKAVEKAFLELAQTDAGKIMLEKIPMKEIGTASLSDYEPLKSMGLERFYQSPF